MREMTQHAGLAAYAVLVRTGVMKQAWARRMFLAAYSVYKTWIEAGPVERLKEFVPPGSTVVDIGANVGFFVLKFARWTGERGCVIAVEPDPENFAALATKVEAAGLKRCVRLIQAAAAAQVCFGMLAGPHHKPTQDADSACLFAFRAMILTAESNR
jgi:tRNA G46 methylase TrmB